MKRAIIWTAIIAGGIGFVAGNAFWYLASPLWIDRVVSESLAPSAQARVVASGKFTDADAVHRGSGMVEAIETGGQTVIRFTDFQVTNGPDLYVWLVRDGGIESSADVKESQSLELGVLKGNIGDQNYILPEGADIADWKTVTIWCRQFGVLFSAAELTGG